MQAMRGSDMTLRNAILLAVLLLITASSHTQTTYFPKGTFSENMSDDQFWSGQFSGYLKAMQEPSLFASSKAGAHTRSQSYRFLWLRAFDYPVSVRFDLGKDGVAVLTLKKTNGVGSSPGHLVEHRRRRLTKEQTDSFLNQVNELGFWQLPGHEGSIVGGADGAQWIIEGFKENEYHVVQRWSPKSGAIRILGLALAVDLGRMKVSEKAIY
jgi:hypothetical protein